MTKKLRDILLEIPDIPAAININWLVDDSREIKKGDLFLAYQGEKIDRKKFIKTVQAKGALVVSDQPGQGDYYLANLKTKIGILAERFWDFPSKKLKIIGVTGTNGKTTIAYLIYQILNNAGIETAFVGTLGVIFKKIVHPTANTTVGALELTNWFAQMIQSGVSTVVMEVSAHALSQFRVEHLIFDTVIFTNLTRDHLDYYSDLASYRDAKAKLFYQLQSRRQIFNLDDPTGKLWCQDFSSTAISYGLYEHKAQITTLDFECTLKGTISRLKTCWGQGSLQSSLIGKYNLSNCLAVIAALGEIFPLNVLLGFFKQIRAPEGRLELLQKGHSPAVVVDYAHTPDALEKILLEMRSFKPRKLGVIFGCGGERDQGKRKMMGKIASELADWIIVTNDNARNEDPEQIASMIISGISLPTYTKILDRKVAINLGIKQGKEGDIIVVAGRGHEACLQIAQTKDYFTDREEVERNLLCY